MRELNVNEVEQVNGGFLALVIAYKAYKGAHDIMKEGVRMMREAWGSISPIEHSEPN